MDVTELFERVRDFSRKAAERAPQVKTEEATKAALVMPFLREVMGYNVNDPAEVEPEFDADFGTRKGEKVDYAILKDGKPIILIECKKYGAPLAYQEASQLFRYFSTTDAQFGILTDGATYQFFTDLDRPNTLDAKPFLEIDLLDSVSIPIEELHKFVKSEFDADEIRATASDLKYTNDVKRLLAEEWVPPSPEFVKFLMGRVYSGQKTKNRMDQFAKITRNALRQMIRERVTSALEQSEGSVETAVQAAREAAVDASEPQSEKPTVVTTEDELTAYYAVKAILHDTIDVRRVTLRDLQSYAAVLLDDKNYKPVCRLWFNGKQRYLGLFDEPTQEGPKHEQKIAIEGVDAIFAHADQIRAAAVSYDRAGG